MSPLRPGATSRAPLGLGLAGCASGSEPAARPAAGAPPAIAPRPAGADIPCDPGVMEAGTFRAAVPCTGTGELETLVAAPVRERTG